MTPDQLEQLNQTIKETIASTVNGKIDRLKFQLDTYIEQDNVWKDSITPSIEIMKKLQGFTSVGGFVLKSILLIGGVSTAIWTFFKFIINQK